MKKGLIITALSLLLVMGFTSCGNKATLVGTWIESAAENSVFGETGFTL